MYAVNSPKWLAAEFLPNRTGGAEAEIDNGGETQTRGGKKGKKSLFTNACNFTFLSVHACSLQPRSILQEVVQKEVDNACSNILQHTQHHHDDCDAYAWLGGRLLSACIIYQLQESFEDGLLTCVTLKKPVDAFETNFLVVCRTTKEFHQYTSRIMEKKSHGDRRIGSGSRWRK